MASSIPLWFTLALTTVLLPTDATGNQTALESVFLRFYKRNYTLDGNAQNASEFVQQMNRNEQVVVYIHGFGESVDVVNVKIVIDSYIMHTDVNLLAVDYRQAASTPYLTAISLAEGVGKILANMLNNMVKSGLDPKKIHIVGHSLGGQIAGYVARNVNFRIPRITGLDPAGPLFYLGNHHLSSSDADFVDIMHCDIGLYGMALKTGHVDFFPNCGHRPQPGCALIGPLLSEKDLCSHHRSTRFYAESIKNPDAFMGIACGNSLEYIVGACDRNNMVAMGRATPSSARGSIFLVTNAQSPFGRGEKGIELGDRCI